MYGSKNSNQYDADLIIETDEATYLGRLQPGYMRTSGDLPVEKQPVWQIERITEEEIPVNELYQNEVETDPEDITEPQDETNTGNDDQTEDPEPEPEPEYPTVTITSRMFPNGREAYEFVMADFQLYDYDFRH